MQGSIQRIFSGLFLIVALNFHATAAVEAVSMIRIGNQVSLGAQVALQDYQYSYMNGNPQNVWPFENASANAWLEAGVDHGSLNYVSTPYDILLIFDVKYWTWNGTTFVQTNQNCTLNVKYNSLANTIDVDRKREMFPGAHRLSAKLINWIYQSSQSPPQSLPPNIYFEGNVTVKRFHKFDETITPPSNSISHTQIDLDGDAVYDELEINWGFIQGAEEYDLEWTFINNYSVNGYSSPLNASDILFNEIEFQRNCTRIRTSEQFYRIPLIMDRGFLIYRVRGIGRGGPASGDFSKVIPGKWSTDGIQLTTINNFPHKYTVGYSYSNPTVTGGHENRKNWQVTTTFAEDGKKKEVISYFDGSLRNRQTVTRINTDNHAIVGETIYDHQGRGAVQVLPAPTDNSVLKFYPDFNVSGTTVNYNRLDFDLDNTSGNCMVTTNPMDSISGAYHYYSSLNPINFQGNNYIPNSKGFPFTLIEYEPDNTGRIRAQTGVGKEHKLGSGHETKYFYGQPEQEQLDRLFGVEVGFSQHYKKNMVVDANGQVSVSYLDMMGRVIATSLAGDPANLNLDPLVNPISLNSLYSESVTNMNVDLLNKQYPGDPDKYWDNNILSFDTLKLSYNSQKVVPTAGDYLFNYTLSNSKFTDSCIGINCFPAVYDLSISVKDQCGTEMLNTPINTTINALGGNPPNYTYTCQNTNYSSGTLTAANLPIGSYSVTKNLKVNQTALDFFAEEYVKLADTNTCLLTKHDFYLENLNNFLNQSDCDYSCADCVSNLIATLGDSTTYFENPVNPIKKAEWYALYNECIEPCEPVSFCQNQFKALLEDVSPNGQYGKIPSISSGNEMILSVFNTSNQLQNYNYGISPNWTNPSPDYVDDLGQPSYIGLTSMGNGVYSPEVITGATIISINGQPHCKPNELKHVSDFLSRWKNSWANSLVKYHPEYPYYQFCDPLSKKRCGENYTSDDFEYAFQTIITWAGAKSATLGNYTTPVNITDSLSNILSLDPLFNCSTSYGGSSGLINSTTGQSYHAMMTGIMNNYKNGMSMKTFAAFSANCGTWYGNNPTSCPGYNSGYGSGTTTIKNATWNFFRSFYLSERQKILQIMADDEMNKLALNNNSAGFCGCIGEQDFNPFVPPHEAPKNYAIPWSNSAALISTQTCTYSKIGYFSSKDRRYGFAKIAPPDFNAIVALTEYQSYLQTGLCPLAINLKNLLEEAATGGWLTTTTPAKALFGINSFSSLLYTTITGMNPNNNAYPNNLTYSTSVSNSTLNISFAGSLQNTCTLVPHLTLTLPNTTNTWAGYGSSWYINRIVAISVSGSNSFKIKIEADNDNNPNNNNSYYLVLTGTTSTCFNLTGCSGNFATSECKPSRELLDLQELMNMLSANGVLNTTTGQNISSTAPYNIPFLRILRSYLPYNTTTNWKWKWDGTSKYLIYDGDASPAFPNDYLEIVFSAGQITGTNPVFTNANHITPGTYNFSMDVSTMSQGMNGYIKDCSSGPVCNFINSGDCGYPTGRDCESSTAQFKTGLLNLLNSFVQYNVSAVREPNNSSGNNKHILSGTPYFNQAMHNYLAVTGNETFAANGTISSTLFNIPIIDKNNSSSPVFCTVELFPLNSYQSSTDFTNIVSFSNLMADLNVLHHGQNFEFTVFAHMGGETAYLRGRSCFPISNCDNCTPEPNSIPDCDTEYSAYVSYLTNLNIHNDSGFYYTSSKFCRLALENCREEYTNYLTSLNITSNTHNAYISLEEFCQGNLGYCATSYDDFYNSISSHLSQHPHLFVSLKDFCKNGWGGNCVSGYTSYINSINWSNPPSTIHTILDHCQDFPLEIPCRPTPIVCPFPPIDQPEIDPCEQYIENIAMANATAQYNQYIESVKEKFKSDYKKFCMLNAIETFNMTYDDAEYHFTLYYYDQGGNLVRTVPPSGVKKIDLMADLVTPNSILDGQDIKNGRIAGARTTQPSHTFLTTYKYNSLNQLVQQSTPDGGTTKFWYDDLGRLVVSQNAKQAATSNWGSPDYPNNYEVYSYTLYDPLGRIFEVGQYQHNSGSPMTETIAKNPSQLSTWLSSGAKREITKTFYDDDSQITFSPNPFGSAGQENLRNRVASVTYQKTYTSSASTFDHGTHYSYDIHGNVKGLVQDNQEMANQFSSLSGEQYKFVAYKFDLISGKVNEVQYQPGKADQFFHRYGYDGDNRITFVETSSDNAFWIQDAKYFYYPHGPLARVELGKNKVQGLDYAYTLHGWIKGVNSGTLNETRDMGQDGNNNQVNLNSYVGRDEAGYTLHYYDGDYLANGIVAGNLSTATNFVINQPANADFGNTNYSKNLYNGNIRQMVTAIREFMKNGAKPLGNAYRYDQLNRITHKQVFDNADMQNNAWGNTSQNLQDYKESFAYDGNGNILELSRNGYGQNINMDFLNYYYVDPSGSNGVYSPQNSPASLTATNKLAYVTDIHSGTVYTDDIEAGMSTTPHNYQYDEIGNLVKDLSEEINKISWTVYGKIGKIDRTGGSNKADMEFRYDAMGNRIAKVVKPRSGGNPGPSSDHVYTYYVRDAQGNVLATYEKLVVSGNDKIYLENQYIYGSARVGMLNNKLDMSTATAPTQFFTDSCGHRSYEMSNHLGNVLAVVSDQRKPIDVGSNGVIDYFMADLLSAQDYYAFGSLLPGRSYQTSTYKYGFNAKENDNEITSNTGTHLDFGARIYDSRLGRWMSVDPEERNYHSNSTFSFCANSPLIFIDKDGEKLSLSLSLRIFHRDVYKATINYIKSESGKEMLRDVVSARQAKRFWNDKGGQGSLFKQSSVKFKFQEEPGGYTDTYVKNKGAKKNIFDVSSSDVATFSKNTKIITKIYLSNTQPDYNENGEKIYKTGDQIQIMLTAGHEMTIHAKFDLKFARSLVAGINGVALTEIWNQTLAIETLELQHGAASLGFNKSYCKFIDEFINGGNSPIDNKKRLRALKYEEDYNSAGNTEDIKKALDSNKINEKTFE